MGSDRADQTVMKKEKQLNMDLPKSAPAVYRQRQLTDESPFPFGKWKGVKMSDVPSPYLDWFTGQAWSAKWPAVLAYIKQTRNAANAKTLP